MSLKSIRTSTIYTLFGCIWIYIFSAKAFHLFQFFFQESSVFWIKIQIQNGILPFIIIILGSILVQSNTTQINNNKGNWILISFLSVMVFSSLYVYNVSLAYGSIALFISGYLFYTMCKYIFTTWDTQFRKNFILGSYCLISLLCVFYLIGNVSTFVSLLDKMKVIMKSSNERIVLSEGRIKQE